MKKILTLSLLLMSAVIFVPSAEAKSANSVEPQVQIQIGRNRNRNRRVRVSNYVRTVRRGRALFRETYRVTYFAGGRTQTRLISRVPIGRIGRRY